jgi:hypothetical protein
MKTIAKTLVAVGILMLSLQMIAANGGNPTAQTSITYVVKINIPHPHIGGNYNLVLYVAMTDANGKPIAPAQRFIPGVFTYVFYEKGPYVGTRVAHLVNDPIVPTNIPFYCAPDSQTGKFLPGNSYLFNLTPTTTPMQ